MVAVEPSLARLVTSPRQPPVAAPGPPGGAARSENTLRPALDQLRVSDSADTPAAAAASDFRGALQSLRSVGDDDFRLGAQGQPVQICSEPLSVGDQAPSFTLRRVPSDRHVAPVTSCAVATGSVQTRGGERDSESDWREVRQHTLPRHFFVLRSVEVSAARAERRRRRRARPRCLPLV